MGLDCAGSDCGRGGVSDNHIKDGMLDPRGALRAPGVSAGYTPGPFSVSGGFLDGPNGPTAILPPTFVRDGEAVGEARERASEALQGVANALNAAILLLDKIE